MGFTKVDAEVLAPIITEIGNQIEALRTAAQAIDTKMTSEEFYDAWQGSSADSCHEAYSEYQDTLVNKIPELCETMNSYVEKCQNELIGLDTELAGK